ncbi:MAG: hypothetical protein WC385_01330 [Candidatus Paceibacterota bacterium]|jgi:hypothetical protein
MNTANTALLRAHLKDLSLEVAKLKKAVQDGLYDPRSLVGDTILNMEASIKKLEEDINSLEEFED